MQTTLKATRSQEIFYKNLFSGFNGYIEIREIDKSGNVKQLFKSYGELANYEAPQNVNVYVGMFERKRKGSGRAENCTKTNAIYLDFDEMTYEGIMFRINHKKLPIPSMIISSGNGYHVYWTLNKPTGEQIKPILEALANALEADTQAAEVARVLRLPDTMNVKKEPLKCELIEANDRTYELETFEKILNVKAEVKQIKTSGIIRELAEIKFNGLHNMAQGVNIGERNFCTGRIAQTLKRLNFTKQEATNILFEWNKLNEKPKDIKELKRDINVFWHDERYKYDGKEFSHDRLQELNEKFITSETTFFKADDTDTHNYDNELLHPKTFKNIRGLTFAILSIVKLAGSEGIRREHIADLCKKHPKDKAIPTTLKLLEEMKYIKVLKRNRINYYVFTEKANYKRGYTAVGKSLHRSFIHGELKEHEYKMMILLENYAYDNKTSIYPSNHTLAYRSGRTDRNVREILKRLEHLQFIKVEQKQNKRYISFIYR